MLRNSQSLHYVCNLDGSSTRQYNSQDGQDQGIEGKWKLHGCCVLEVVLEETRRGGQELKVEYGDAKRRFVDCVILLKEEIVIWKEPDLFHYIDVRAL